MTIEIYKSALCPRCAYALHTLKKLQEEYNDLEIKTYDIVTDFKTFKKSGVKMLPTLKINDTKKSWIFPKASDIKDFVLENR